MKSFLAGCALLLSAIISYGQTAANTWAVKFATAIRLRHTPTINAMTGKGWEYSNSIILHGMEKVYNNVPDSASYLNYIKAYVDSYVDASGTITGMAQSLDKIHPGILCLFLYEKTGLAKYHTAATYLRNYLVGGSSVYPKTSEGGYWHKNNGSYDNIMMLDGIYMAEPFLAKYGKMFSDNTCFDVATTQALLIASHLKCNGTNALLKHAYDHTKTQNWCNHTNGASFQIWSRGMGWYMMALVDILKYLPPSHTNYNAIKNLLGQLALGIQATQDPTTHLWYQVVNKGGSPGNYIETSGSAMFIYAIKTAVDSGWINSSFLPVAKNGWIGLQAKISTLSDGTPKINDFAPAMGVLTGSSNDSATAYTAYVNTASVDCPTAVHPHGYAAVLMAASVMEFPINVTLPVRFLGFTAKKNPGNITLTWRNEDQMGVDHYEIQKGPNGAEFTTAGIERSTSSPVYSWVDNNIDGNTVYYRIKAVSADGHSYYSAILPVRQNNRAPGMQIFPNPVTDGAINLFLNNLGPGKYFLKVINSAGTITAIKTIDITNERNSIQMTSLPAPGKGICYIQLEGNDLKINEMVIVR
jgi:unsaturated rhamnogalacturonyl hydrolase